MLTNGANSSSSTIIHRLAKGAMKKFGIDLQWQGTFFYLHLSFFYRKSRDEWCSLLSAFGNCSKTVLASLAMAQRCLLRYFKLEMKFNRALLMLIFNKSISCLSLSLSSMKWNHFQIDPSRWTVPYVFYFGNAYTFLIYFEDTTREGSLETDMNNEMHSTHSSFIVCKSKKKTR